MLRGYLATAWVEAIESCGGTNVDRKMNSIQRLLWDTYFMAIWKRRNTTLHDEENKYNTAEDRALTERIEWYVEHKEEALAAADQFLASHDITTLHRMRRATKREWVRHLDRVRESYELELKQRASRQNMITRYLHPTTTNNSSDSSGEGRGNS